MSGTKLYCPNCGTAASGEDVYCSECGTKLPRGNSPASVSSASVAATEVRESDLIEDELELELSDLHAGLRSGSDKLVEEWTLQCRHCGKNFSQNENQLKGGHMMVTLKLMMGATGAEAREIMENHMIPCPSCEKLVPFEPMSRFRDRKVAALDERLQRLETLFAAGGKDAAAILLIKTSAALLREFTRTLYPIETLRTIGERFQRFTQKGLKKLTHPMASDHEALRLFQDMQAIAAADIGDKVDLPDAPSDEMVQAGEGFLQSLAGLADEQRGSQPSPAFRKSVKELEKKLRNPPSRASTSAKKATPPEPPVGEVIGGCLIILVILGLAGWGIWWAASQNWEFSKDESERRFEGLPNISALAFSPDGQRVAGGGDHDLRVWDVKTGLPLYKHEWKEGWVGHIAFSADGKSLYAAGSMGGDHLSWSLETGEAKKQFYIDGVVKMKSAPPSPDGQFQVTYRNKELDLVEKSTGKKIRSFFGHSGEVRAVTFSPDGKKILSGAADLTLRLWDVETGNQERMWNPGVTSTQLLYLPDGKRFVSVDGPYARLWKLDADKSTLLMGHFWRDVTALAAGPDSKHIVTGSTGGVVRLWKMPE